MWPGHAAALLVVKGPSFGRREPLLLFGPKPLSPQAPSSLTELIKQKLRLASLMCGAHCDDAFYKTPPHRYIVMSQGWRWCAALLTHPGPPTDLVSSKCPNKRLQPGWGKVAWNAAKVGAGEGRGRVASTSSCFWTSRSPPCGGATA